MTDPMSTPPETPLSLRRFQPRPESVMSVEETTPGAFVVDRVFDRGHE